MHNAQLEHEHVTLQNTHEGRKTSEEEKGEGKKMALQDNRPSLATVLSRTAGR